MDQVDKLMQRGIDQRWFQSATLLAAVDDQPVLHRAYGKATLDTVFDLASLTKPLATSATLMLLVADNKLSLNDSLDRLVPQTVGTPAGPTKIWQLLSHSSGLPAWLPFYDQLSQRSPGARKAALRKLAASQPLQAKPGSRSVYSDLGYILLDWVIETISGQPLDRFFSARIAAPLGLTRTRFILLKNRELLAPLAQGSLSAELKARWPIAPTERCPRRKRRLVAEVHDDNTHAMGGISGHAGLFGSAYDVHLITRQLVAAYQGRPSIFSGPVVRKFFDFRGSAKKIDGKRSKRSNWALGWDRPGNQSAAAGSLFGKRTVGHLGFTGTSLWIDLERRLWAILLTNRVYFGRESNPMISFRPRLHNRLLHRL